MRPVLLVSVALVAVGVGACEGYVRRGSTLYADGRYVEAAEVFERTEARLTDSTPRERAEYGLYRGMTLLVLGDLSNARRWLAYAYEVERSFPGALRPDRRALLDRGWFELGQRMRSELERTARETDSAAAAARHAKGDDPPPAPPEAGTRATPTSERALVPR